MQGLNGHAKIHIQKTLRCTECEYTCTTMNKLNTHMRTHTGDEIQNEPLTEKAKTPVSETPKRGLSLSPEVANLDDKKDSRKTKKSKKLTSC